MLKYDPKYHLVSLHLMKCGGTSLGLILKEWFADGYHGHYVDHKFNKIPPAVSLKSVFGSCVEGICIHGHFMDGIDNAFDVYPDTRQFITFLRDPLLQAISLFHFAHHVIEESGCIHYQGSVFSKPVYIEHGTGKPMETDDLDEFLVNGKSPVLSFLPFDLTSDNYRGIFNRYFVHVGCYEKYETSVNILADKLGKNPPTRWPHLNKGDYTYDLSTSTIDAFNKQHVLEKEMHEYSRSLNRP